jgi:hypothetical protein
VLDVVGRLARVLELLVEDVGGFGGSLSVCTVRRSGQRRGRGGKRARAKGGGREGKREGRRKREGKDEE